MPQPGFKHEMKYHLTDLEPPIDPLTGAPLLDAENYCCGTLADKLVGKHNAEYAP